MFRLFLEVLEVVIPVVAASRWLGSGDASNGLSRKGRVTRAPSGFWIASAARPGLLAITLSAMRPIAVAAGRLRPS